MTIKERLETMELHEVAWTDEERMGWMITRVIDGWIYTYHRLDCNAMTSVFVPDNN